MSALPGFYTDPWGVPPSQYGTLVAPTTNPAPASTDGAAAMGYAGLASSVISAVGNYFLSRTQARSMKQQFEYQRDMSRINAENMKRAERGAERTAQSVLDQGQKAIGNLTMRAGKVKSAQRAAMAANGIDLGEGNAAEVQATTDLMKEIDSNTLEANAIRSAWGYRMEGINRATDVLNYESQARMQGATGDSISTSQAGMNSLMSGATNVASNWYALRRSGAI